MRSNAIGRPATTLHMVESLMGDHGRIAGAPMALKQSEMANRGQHARVRPRTAIATSACTPPRVSHSASLVALSPLLLRPLTFATETGFCEDGISLRFRQRECCPCGRAERCAMSASVLERRRGEITSDECATEDRAQFGLRASPPASSPTVRPCSES